MYKSRYPFKIIAVSILVLVLMSFSIFLIKRSGYWLTYQVTPSMPKGFYLIEPIHQIERGDIVVFSPPAPILALLSAHHWAPDDGILMKHVMGMPGDEVCNKKGYIWINGKRIGPVYHYYAPGKRLPSGHFCGRLQKGSYLLLSTDVKRSLDGRYFGPVKKNRIIGKAIRLM